MAVFVPYKNLVEITGLIHDDTWRTSGSLINFLQNPTASGVLIRVQNGNAGACNGGVYGLAGGGTDANWNQSMAPSGGFVNAVRFQKNIGATSTGLSWIRYRLENALVKAYIVGEFQAGIAWDPIGITVNPDSWEDNNVWLDRTVTVLGDDAVGDVEAVILSFTAANTGDDGLIGLRAKGSANEDLFGLTFGEAGLGWEAVKVDSNGQYQIYCTAKEDVFIQGTLIQELGYIRKNSGYTAIEDPQKETLGVVGAWTVDDLAALVPESCRVAVMKWGEDTVAVALGVREVGGVDEGFIVNDSQRLGCQVLRLPLSKEYEYLTSQAAKGLHVVGYEAYEPDEDALTVAIDSGVSLVIEGNSSAGVG